MSIVTLIVMVCDSCEKIMTSIPQGNRTSDLLIYAVQEGWMLGIDPTRARGSIYSKLRDVCDHCAEVEPAYYTEDEVNDPNENK